MHLQPFFNNYKFFSSLIEGSVSENLFNRGICLPSDTKIDRSNISTIIDIIVNLF